MGGGEASNIQIAVYDGQTLELKRTFPLEPESGQDECSGIAVDAATGSVWMCSWTATGRYLYRYDLETGAYLGRVQLHASPQWIQGVAAHEGSLFLTADDGDEDLGEPDHVYRVTVEQDATHATVALERTLDDVTLQGEIEGLTFTEMGICSCSTTAAPASWPACPLAFMTGTTTRSTRCFRMR